MKKSKFLLFLIASMALTAFLAGYIMVQKGTPISSGTGTILDKFNNNPPTTLDDQEKPTNGPTLITDKKVFSATNSLDKGDILYFEKNTGKLYAYNLDTKIERVISDKAVPDFISALWSPTKKEILGYFTSSNGIITKYINLGTGKEVVLNNAHSVAFSPDGNLIAYYSADNASDSESAENTQGINNIIISQPDGQYQKKVLTTRVENPILGWPDKETLAFRTPGQEIYLLSEDHKLSKLLDTKIDLGEKWSPSGNKLLFSALSANPDESDTKLWVKDRVLNQEKELIPGLASKCIWSIDSVNAYCAFSKSPSSDDIYIINTDDGSSKLVLELNMAIKEMFLSPTEDYLIFTNSSDDKLYSIKIPD